MEQRSLSLLASRRRRLSLSLPSINATQRHVYKRFFSFRVGRVGFRVSPLLLSLSFLCTKGKALKTFTTPTKHTQKRHHHLLPRALFLVPPDVPLTFQPRRTHERTCFQPREVVSREVPRRCPPLLVRIPILSLFFFCVCVPGRCFILGIFSLARVKSDDVVEEEEHGG